jgi:hypothetical protein
METAGFESQVMVLATRVNGEVNWAPLAGVVMVMAEADVALTATARNARKEYFICTLSGVHPGHAFGLTRSKAACMKGAFAQTGLSHSISLRDLHDWLLLRTIVSIIALVLANAVTAITPKIEIIERHN